MNTKNSIKNKLSSIKMAEVTDECTQSPDSFFLYSFDPELYASLFVKNN